MIPAASSRMRRRSVGLAETWHPFTSSSFVPIQRVLEDTAGLGPLFVWRDVPKEQVQADLERLKSLPPAPGLSQPTTPASGQDKWTIRLAGMPRDKNSPRRGNFLLVEEF